MPSSWGSIEDFKNKYGGERVVKLATHSFWDEDLEDFVVDRSPERIDSTIQAALDEAQAMLTALIRARFSNASIVTSTMFPSIRFYHLKLAMIILQDGSNCKACERCLCEFKECLDIEDICVGNVCLRRGAAISVTPKRKSKCDPCGCGSCCACKGF